MLRCVETGVVIVVGVVAAVVVVVVVGILVDRGCVSINVVIMVINTY